MMWAFVIGLYLLVMGMFIFLWYFFCEIRKGYWQDRNVDFEIPQNRFDKMTKEHFKSMEPKPHGARIKPKSTSDAKLYELEQNPAKR